MSFASADASALTLYTRPGCHLCEQARALLDAAIAGTAVTVTEANIDADAALRARYDVRIPVVAVAGVDRLEWPFDARAVRRLVATLTGAG